MKVNILFSSKKALNKELYNKYTTYDNIKKICYYKIDFTPTEIVVDEKDFRTHIFPLDRGLRLVSDDRQYLIFPNSIADMTYDD